MNIKTHDILIKPINNIKLYITLSKVSFSSLQIYNAAILVMIIRNALVFMLQIALWYAIHKSNNDLSLPYIINYLFLSQIITVMYPRASGRKISRLIATGNIMIKFLRPISIFTELFFDNLARSFYFFLVNSIPLTIIYYVMFKQLPHIHFSGAIIIFCLYSYVLCFLFECIFGCLSFFTYSFWGIQSLEYALTGLLTGKFIPLRFYPQWLLKYINILPFKYMYYFPIEQILQHEKSVLSTFDIFAMLLYLLGFMLLLTFAYRKGKVCVTIQGG
ncbi:hypothetical protein HMPREF1222_01289 [Treponema vincentii F0403]|uniref:ABC-2 type transporter domain-containing protein n=2 Tax=Treponema vincentii TaxID=69710 RepID=S3LQV8_9SPIR|nr:hypothetical protein HMPREF1222_01289 [Treponema vincentii F0403]